MMKVTISDQKFTNCFSTNCTGDAFYEAQSGLQTCTDHFTLWTANDAATQDEANAWRIRFMNSKLRGDNRQ